MVDLARDPVLLEVLERSRQLGLLGPGPVVDHVDHAGGVVEILDRWRPAGARGLDLGSGGGVPGLILVRALPRWHWTLLDAQRRRTDVLDAALRRLEPAGSTAVVRGRAEDVARDPSHREAYDVVVARSFGPPAVTAECAAAFVVDGGLVVVSEPPGPRPGRWDDAGLEQLGLARPAEPALSTPGWVVLERRGAVPDAVPRRDGRPAKRPLWTDPAD